MSERQNKNTSKLLVFFHINLNFIDSLFSKWGKIWLYILAVVSSLACPNQP